MMNLASTNTQKMGTHAGAGGWQERWWPIMGLGIRIHCSSAVLAFEGINLPAGSLSSHRGFLPFSFFCPQTDIPSCAAGGSPPPFKFNLQITFTTGAFPELLNAAPVLSAAEQSTLETGGRSGCVSRGDSGASADCKPLSACALHAYLRKILNLGLSSNMPEG